MKPGARLMINEEELLPYVEPLLDLMWFRIGCWVADVTAILIPKYAESSKASHRL